MKSSTLRALAHVLVGVLAIALSSLALEAQAQLPDRAASQKEIRAIVVLLQAAIRNDQRRTIATLILFPMEIIKAPLGVHKRPFGGRFHESVSVRWCSQKNCAMQS